MSMSESGIVHRSRRWLTYLCLACWLAVAFVNLSFGQLVYQTVRPLPAGDNPGSAQPDTSMGDMPIGQLIEGADGKLYGTASFSGFPSTGGGVFRVNKDGSGFVTLYKSGLVPNDSSTNLAGLVQGSDGSFFGTSFSGGTNNLGTVFRLTSSGNGGYTNKILKSFTGSNGDGANPACKLIIGVDGWGYGTTYNGGTNNLGVIFKMQTNGLGFTNLHTFSAASTDSSHPLAGLVQGTNGMLFGVSSNGAANARGAIYRINTNGTGYSNLHSFTGTSGDGMYPVANLVCDNNNTVYGVTLLGGASGFGTVFKINGDGTGYAVLTNFTGNTGNAPGAQPRGCLAMGNDGLLYGTAEFGGSTNNGIIFRMSKTGSGYTVLHSFDYTTDHTDGRNPRSGLTQGADGAFYGTTLFGGLSPNPNFTDFATDTGAIFSLGANPPNDTFVNRISLVGFGATGAGYNLNATLETNEPPHLNSTDTNNIIAATNSIWWSWSGLSNGLVTIVDDANTVQALIDVYTNLSANCVANPSGLVNWWRGENNGNDSAGANNAGLSNGVAFATGMVGRAFSFDGIDDFLQIGAPAISPPWSAEFWVNRQATTNDSAVLLGDFATALKLEQFQNTHRVGYTIWGVGDYSFNYTAPLGTWTHLVFVGSSSNIQLYANGVSQGTIATNWTLPRGTIGYDVARGNKKQLKGLLDEISLYNRMLTPAEIQALYTAGASGKCTVDNLGLVASNSNSSALGSESRVSFNAKAGVTYQVAVSGTVDMSVGPHFAGSGPISLSMRTVDLKPVSLSWKTNLDSTTTFTNQLQIGNGGSTTPGPLRVELIAQAGFSTAPSSNLGILLLPDRLLTNYVLANPNTVAPNTTTNITYSAVCPAPTNYVVNGITNPIGWGVFAQLEEQVGTNWFLKDRALVAYSVWPSSGGFQGPGGGVVRINPTGGGGPVVRLTNTMILGPLTVNEGTTNAYQGFARFSDGGTFTFSNTVWTSSLFSINTNGLFAAGSVKSDTPVTLACYYVFNDKTNNASTNVLVLNLPAPRLTNFTVLPTRQVQFTINGVPGRFHIIEATTNLGTPTIWTALATNAISSSGNLIFTDPAASGFFQRFYRAHEQ